MHSSVHITISTHDSEEHMSFSHDFGDFDENSDKAMHELLTFVIFYFAKHHRVGDHLGSLLTTETN